MTIQKMLLLALAGIFASAGFAQATNDTQTVQDSCVKAVPGKSAELQAFIQNVEVPIHQAEADSGDFSAWLEMRAVIPSGEWTKCDYRFAAIYNHGIADFPSPEQTEAAIKRAKLNISLQDYLKQREALARLVDVEIWVGLAGAGTHQQKGDFLRFNHYHLKPHAGAEWSRIEKTYWKLLVDDWTKAGNKGNWGMYLLWMPDGENQPYNAMTYDDFPNWNSLVNGSSALVSFWPKVHPGTDLTSVLDQMDRACSLYNAEIYQISELVVATAPETK